MDSISSSISSVNNVDYFDYDELLRDFYDNYETGNLSIECLSIKTDLSSDNISAEIADVEEIDLPQLDPDRSRDFKPYGQGWDAYPKSHRKKIKLQNKKHIRCLFILRMPYLRNTYDYGLLTDDFEFYYCKIVTRYVDITTDLWLKLRRTFMPFNINMTTDIMMTDNISCYEPVVFYLKILQEQLFFNMKIVSKKQIIRRIETYHRGYVKKRLKKVTGATLQDMPILWNKLVETSVCPWINSEVENALNKLPFKHAERQRYLRLALYYMLIKQHYINKNIYYRSKSKNKNV